MSILHPPSVALYTNPAIRAGLDTLSWWLEENHYSSHAREAIVAYTAAEGTPTGCVYLEAEDESAATEAFVAALPAVAYDSAAWGDNGPDDGDRSIPADAVLVPPELLELAPIVGGASESFTPTDEVLADYAAWSAELDAREEIRRMEDVRNPMWGYE